MEDIHILFHEQQAPRHSRTRAWEDPKQTVSQLGMKSSGSNHTVSHAEKGEKNYTLSSPPLLMRK